MLGPGTGRVHATDKGRAGRRTHRRGGPAVKVHHSPGRQAIEMRRLGILVAVTTQFRTVILRGNPENIGQLLLGAEVKRNYQAQEKDSH